MTSTTRDHDDVHAAPGTDAGFPARGSTPVGRFFGRFLARFRAIRRPGVRPEIQALRAIAVGSVVLFHLRPNAIPGGFVGVDVFFVISGFLITSHLLREIDVRGRLDVASFWARRARRLLPASALVLVVCAILTILVIPGELRAEYFKQISASALYVENWTLAADSVDYMAAANQPTLVQHFWSLSVEEQFYIALPIIIAITVLFTKRIPKGPRRALLAVFVVAFLGSLAYSVYLTAASPSAAYFVTPTRAWEFAAGGLLAFARPRFRPAARAAMSWAGLAAIGIAVFAFSGSTPFPGFTALLPVVGTLLVIAAGDVRGRFGTAWLLDPRPVQYLGDISYSVYLWHWPLIVVMPFVLGHPIGKATLLGILGLTLVLAILTRRFVEDPVRKAPFLKRRNWPAFALAATSALVLVSVSVYGTNIATADVAAAAHRSAVLEAKHARCFGAMAIADNCAVDPSAPVDPNFARNDLNPMELDGCQGGIVDSRWNETQECTYGDPRSKTTVVLVGDSHARQWISALEVVAKKRDWKIVTLYHASCPFGDTPDTWIGHSAGDCAQWRVMAMNRILQLHPTRVFTSALRAYNLAGYDIGTPQQQLTGYSEYLQKLTAAGIPVSVMDDGPFLPEAAPDCIAEHGAGGCAYPRAQVMDAHPDELSIAAATVPGVQVIDLQHYFCPTDMCPTVIGGVIMYEDQQHLTASYSRSLGPLLDKAIGPEA